MGAQPAHHQTSPAPPLHACQLHPAHRCPLPDRPPRQARPPPALPGLVPPARDTPCLLTHVQSAPPRAPALGVSAVSLPRRVWHAFLLEERVPFILSGVTRRAAPTGFPATAWLAAREQAAVRLCCPAVPCAERALGGVGCAGGGAPPDAPRMLKRGGESARAGCDGTLSCPLGHSSCFVVFLRLTETFSKVS